jgi:putative transposase
MKQVLTVSCKIVVTSEQSPKVDNTLQVFAAACEYVHETLPENLTNEMAMQSVIYQDVRAKFGLPSQLAIHAIRRVSGNRKTAKSNGDKVKNFAPTSVTYDIRTFQLREQDWTVSLTMVGKRERFQLHIGNYQKSLLKGQNPKSAVLVLKDGEYRVNIQLESHPEPSLKVDYILGIDLGRTDIAVTSEGESFSGKDVTATRDHYAKLRSSIQKKASKGTL